MLGIGEADSPIGKKFNEVFHMYCLEIWEDIREFIYTYILQTGGEYLTFCKRIMIELERLQEISRGI